MRKALIGLLVSAVLFGVLAGFSGASRISDDVSALRDRWAAIQSMPAPDERLQQMKQLRSRADQLQQRYPDNDEVSQWAGVIDRSTTSLKARQRNAG